MIRLKQLLFEQTGTTNINVGGTDVVGTAVDNTQSTRDPWTYFVGNDGNYYTKKKTGTKWINLQTALTPANFDKAKSRIDSWKVAAPAATPSGENPVQPGDVKQDKKDGSVDNKTNAIPIDQIESLPVSPGTSKNPGELANNILTFTDTEPRVIDLTGVENLNIITDGPHKVAIDSIDTLTGTVKALTDKSTEAVNDTNTLEAVVDPASTKFILFQFSGNFVGIIKTKSGKYRAMYMTI